MSDKSLGQVAHRARLLSLGPNATEQYLSDQWDAMNVLAQQAWHAAAEAVAEVAMSHPTVTQTGVKTVRQLHAEHAVIEAAKEQSRAYSLWALCESADERLRRQSYRRACQRTNQLVRVLQAAKGGE